MFKTWNYFLQGHKEVKDMQCFGILKKNWSFFQMYQIRAEICDDIVNVLAAGMFHDFFIEN